MRKDFKMLSFPLKKTWRFLVEVGFGKAVPVSGEVVEGELSETLGRVAPPEANLGPWKKVPGLCPSRVPTWLCSAGYRSPPVDLLTDEITA